jgi:hypothetical protein
VAWFLAIHMPCATKRGMGLWFVLEGEDNQGRRASSTEEPFQGSETLRPEFMLLLTSREKGK